MLEFPERRSMQSIFCDVTEDPEDLPSKIISGYKLHKRLEVTDCSLLEYSFTSAIVLSYIFNTCIIKIPVHSSIFKGG